MLDPYENVSSTGEPPTTTESSNNNDDNLFSSHPLRSVVDDNPSSRLGVAGQDSPLSSSGGRSRTLSVQELDSGYEASPSSIADHQTFFGDHQSSSSSVSAVAVPIMDLLESCSLGDFEFVDCHHASRTRYDSAEESDSDDYDTCQDCCYGCSRTDSSSTNTAVCCGNCDSSRSDLNSRPSSQPIQVPTQSGRLVGPDVRSRLRHSLGSLLDMYPEARSLPVHLHSLGLIPENHPLSWPSIPHSALSGGGGRRRRAPVALPSPRNHHVSMDIPRRMNNSSSNPRNRRQIIDSEASSFCSSDDEGPEDVFNMSGEEPRSFLMTSSGSVPLPDIVLASTDSSRRGRSASVNLPLERRLEVIRGVGQRLRRMSDLFDQRRELCIAVIRLRNRRASDCFELRPS